MWHVAEAGIGFFAARAGGGTRAEVVLLRKRGQPHTPLEGHPPDRPGFDGGGVGKKRPRAGLWSHLHNRRDGITVIFSKAESYYSSAWASFGSNFVAISNVVSASAASRSILLKWAPRSKSRFFVDFIQDGTAFLVLPARAMSNARTAGSTARNKSAANRSGIVVPQLS